jgi:linoleoyl-CoA desaturase
MSAQKLSLPLHSAEASPAIELAPAPDQVRALKFAADGGFFAEARQRVQAYFQRTGKRERDCPRMYVKTAAILTAYAVIYGLLVFVVQSCWLAVPLAILLAFVVSMIGFCIQHDGNHRAYSDRPWINRITAATLDLLGASSF